MLQVEVRRAVVFHGVPTFTAETAALQRAVLGSWRAVVLDGVPTFTAETAALQRAVLGFLEGRCLQRPGRRCGHGHIQPVVL